MAPCMQHKHASSSVWITPHEAGPFRSVDEVVDGLKRLKSGYVARGDRRGAFATIYVVTTTTLHDWIRQDRFASRDLFGDYLVTFANAYRAALAASESSGPLPGAWRVALDAQSPSTLLEDLMLGINAHVNHDLPFAIVDAGLDTRCPLCRRDHEIFNEALRKALPRARREIASIYRPYLTGLNRLFGGLLDRRIARSVVRARDQAWAAAQALQEARSPEEKARVGAEIARRAAEAGRLIQTSRHSLGRCLAILGSAGAAPPTVPGDFGSAGEARNCGYCARHKAVQDRN